MKDQVLNINKTVPALDAARIEEIEGKLLEQEQVECPVIHRFGPGTYIREVHLPKGSVVIGHHQNFEHTNIMLKGHLALLNEDGSTTECKAPMIFTGRPGRKIAYVFEDVVWMNVYPNTDNTQDVETLENKWLTKSETFKLSQEKHDQLLIGTREIHNLKKQENVVPLPFGAFKAKIGKSKIHGYGLFATADVEPKEVLGPAKIRGSKTILGGYPNHAKNPNARFQNMGNGDTILVAIYKISGCRGGFNGDEITVDYNDAIKEDPKLMEGVEWLE